MSNSTPNLNLFKYDVSTDANVPFSITEALNNNWDIIDAKCGQSNNILDFKWSDHLLNDMSWLRADTFSWQDGTTYSQAYNELLTEYNDSASVEETEGSIPFKRTPKGYKIALSTQETAIAEKYATDGIAWYYILDTTNKKFKLPRTKFGFEGLRTGVGNDIEAGLPNITGNISGLCNNSSSAPTTSGALNLTNTYTNPNGQYAANYTYFSGGSVNLDASNSSSIYGNSETVQPPATQMYLYFYVGAFTKSAETQTAGLKAELLNSKLDLNANNIDTAGKSLISGLSMPSEKYIDLTLSASGTEYTAPANGYFFCQITANGQLGFVLLYSTMIGTGQAARAGSSSDGCRCFIPVKKGETIKAEYDNISGVDFFRFIYAEGAKED